MDCEEDELRRKLQERGFCPGPITATTRDVYVRLLSRLSISTPTKDKSSAKPVSDLNKSTLPSTQDFPASSTKASNPHNSTLPSPPTLSPKPASNPHSSTLPSPPTLPASPTRASNPHSSTLPSPPTLPASFMCTETGNLHGSALPSPQAAKTLSASPAKVTQTLPLSSEPADQSPDLFVSYNRDSTPALFLESFTAHMTAAGYSVWRDSTHIPSGKEWHTAVAQALVTSRCFLCVLTEGYLQSQYCTKELFLAEDKRKPIFPVLLGSVDLDASPGVALVVSSLNWITPAAAARCPESVDWELMASDVAAKVVDALATAM